jgi:hypothetical protein
MDQDNDHGEPEEKQIIVLKAPLAKILRDAQHLEIYRDTVKSINRVVTAAYLLTRYIFVHAYEDHPNFNADIYINTDFFCEVLRALQTRTRRRSTLEATIRNRQLIDSYIEHFCVLYQYHLIRIEGVASNLEQYISRQMVTAYLNNAEFRSGQHFRTVLNTFFDVKGLRATFRCQNSNDNDKKLARAYLADISSFKNIISTASTYGDIESLKLESTNWMVWVIIILMHSFFSRRGWNMLEMVLIAKIRSGMSSRPQNPFIRYINWLP